jgi:hypothetical protein
MRCDEVDGALDVRLICLQHLTNHLAAMPNQGMLAAVHGFQRYVAKNYFLKDTMKTLARLVPLSLLRQFNEAESWSASSSGAATSSRL